MLRQQHPHVEHPAACSCDLGAVDDRRSVPAAVGHVRHARTGVAGSACAAAVDVHARRGRHGVPAFRDALDEWVLDGKPTDSVLEPAMHRLVARPRPATVQFHAVICGYEVDFWIVDSPVVLECDGWETHGRDRVQFERDRVRDARTGSGAATSRCALEILQAGQADAADPALGAQAGVRDPHGSPPVEHRPRLIWAVIVPESETDPARIRIPPRWGRSEPVALGSPAMATEFPPFDGSAPKHQEFKPPPEMGIDPEKRYTATLDTSLGEIVIALDAVKAPKTVNNFVFLALHHYYDGVIFHRIINGFMCQGGDPPAPAGAARATGSRTSCRRPASTRSAPSPWPTPAPTPTAASSSSSPATTACACRRVQPVRPDRQGPRRARDDAARAHRRRRPPGRGRRHQLGRHHRVRLTSDRWARSTGARRSSPGPVAASARRSPSPSTPPAPGSPSSPARPTSS